MLIIMALFHASPCKDFKHFYLHGVEGECRGLFAELACYARFVQTMAKDLMGKIFADKAYISKDLFDTHWRNELQLITGIRKKAWR